MPCMYHRAFCKCVDLCTCAYTLNGESLTQHLAWNWSGTHKTDTASTRRFKDGQTVDFHNEKSHLGYSNGNACIRGDTPFVHGNHYFWEMRVLRPVYGSSVMVGVGTGNVQFNKFRTRFCHMLGNDDQSWGLSFNGPIHHKNTCSFYHERAGFTNGSLIGVHLDMWNGTLEFFVNREPLGIAYRGLQNKTLYPMISSTASCSSMRLTYAIILPHSLMFLTLKRLLYSEFQKLPYKLKRTLSECWWYFPKSSLNDDESCDVVMRPRVFQIIVTDSDDDDEGSRMLSQRMKRVLENSGEFRSCGNKRQRQELP